ncbi:MAG: 50S ribosomal protein L24 [bacterium]|nr:50S ribosomal protein L24 [bacterium]
MNIKKGDTVKILTGKNRGKSGKVLKVFTERGLVSVEGINVYKKHVRPKKQGEKGEVVSLARPLQASNVQVICPACSRSARVGFRKSGETKVRYCKKCNADI